VPPGFRANSIFIGMKKELKTIDEKLFDERNEAGTTCVLLHGQPGVGKSHLARQYIYENRHKFQGGIYWINAHLMVELESGFWNIAQKVIAKVSPELILSIKDPNCRYIDTVKTWFELRSEWLIVLDGISAENEDIAKLHQFVPDSKNSSIIYISRSARFEAMHRLLDPVAIKVNPLKEAEGRELLFQELHIERPRPAQIKSANALIKKIGGLPLAINAIARRIADTRVPLEKYSIKSYSDDPKLAGTYRIIMDDLRKNRHREALNLISILCFFGPHIPVEMIHLGMKALKDVKIETKTSEIGDDTDLNSTFAVLMQHALIERNEPDDNISMSGSRNSLQDPEPIDMLKMHTVVQKFCADSLYASKELPVWLEYAVQLFIRSYHEADARISSRPEPGRVSDYRQYSIHGEQLRQNTKIYDGRLQPLRKLRKQLDGVLESISQKIQSMEISSSQENVNNVSFQCSIFDRTNISSSSSNTQSDDRSPCDSSPCRTQSLDSFENQLALSPDELPMDTGIGYGLGMQVYSPDQMEEAYKSVPMQKKHSDSPTIRPYEHMFVANGRVDVKPCSPMTNLNPETVSGLLSKTTEQRDMSDLMSSLSYLKQRSQAPSQPDGDQPILSPTPLRIGNPIQNNQVEKGHELPDRYIITRVPARIASAPAQSAYAPPGMTSKFTGADQPYNSIRPRTARRSLLSSEYIPTKSPLAPAVMSPMDNGQLWDAQGYPFPQSGEGIVNISPQIPSEQIRATTGDTSFYNQDLILAQPGTSMVVGRMDGGPWNEQELRIPASGLDRPLLSSKDTLINDNGILQQVQNANLPTLQMASRTHNGFPVHTRVFRSPYQQQSYMTPQHSPRSSVTSTPRLRGSEVSPKSRSPKEQKNNSPPLPTHMFSSVSSDVTPTYVYVSNPLVHPDSSLQGINGHWTTGRTHTLQDQNQNMPSGSRPFTSTNNIPTSIATTPSSSRVTGQPGTRPVSGPGIRVDGLGLSGHGMGIAEFGSHSPIPFTEEAFANLPPSDPRRRLRERNTSPYGRQSPQFNHPLAPRNSPVVRIPDENLETGLWYSAERNTGTRSSAPYPELSRIPTGSMSLQGLVPEPSNIVTRKRNLSAPESPGWGGPGDADGWLS
jgi:hypothetical protein